MNTQANAPAETISLPTGGGALKGIGETFSPDLHTGTGNFTIPLALPPGRDGFQPKQDLGPVTFTLTGWTRDEQGPVASVTVEVVKGGTVVASASAARQGENWTAQVAGLSQGTHEVRVTARDTPGNPETETLAFTVFPIEPPRIETDSPVADQGWRP